MFCFCFFPGFLVVVLSLSIKLFLCEQTYTFSSGSNIIISPQKFNGVRLNSVYVISLELQAKLPCQYDCNHYASQMLAKQSLEICSVM